MRQEFFNNVKNDSELYMVNCGYEDCCPQFVCPLHRRDYYLVHYVTKGSGFYEVNGQRHEVHEGDLFFIYPDDLVTYSSPDIANTWSFCWIGFAGSAAQRCLLDAGVPEKTYVLHLNSRSFFSLIKNCIDYIETSGENLSQYRLMICLYEVFDLLRNKCHKKTRTQQPSSYADRAVRYIEFNYMNGIKPKDICNYLSIDRTYLYRILRTYMHISPEQYLIQYRLGKAIELMREGKYTLKDIGSFVGISDVYHFSKLFKKNMGVSPREYMKTMN